MPPSTAHASALLVAAVLVHDPATDRVVLLQRGPESRFSPGCWDLPVGKCEAGEPLPSAAVRELREETGLVVEPDDLHLAHVVHGAHGVDAPNGFLTVVLATRRWSGTLRNAEPAKHSAVRWTPVDSLPADTVPPAAEALAHYREGRSRVLLTGWT